MLMIKVSSLNIYIVLHFLFVVQLRPDSTPCQHHFISRALPSRIWCKNFYFSKAEDRGLNYFAENQLKLPKRICGIYTDVLNSLQNKQKTISLQIMLLYLNIYLKSKKVFLVFSGVFLWEVCNQKTCFLNLFPYKAKF